MFEIELRFSKFQGENRDGFWDTITSFVMLLETAVFKNLEQILPEESSYLEKMSNLTRY